MSRVVRLCIAAGFGPVVRLFWLRNPGHIPEMATKATEYKAKRALFDLTPPIP
jgi:hypothetical protein